MVIAIFGESCTGKSTLAETLQTQISAQSYTGKDYLRLAKSEAEAEKRFRTLLADALNGDHVIYVCTEPTLLALVPDGAVRVLVTADLSLIKTRFAARMHGVLPPPVAAMLEAKHGVFDRLPHDVHVVAGETDVAAACAQILAKLGAN